MANMSYCRWQNTIEDLEDCYEHIEDKIDNPAEDKARKHLIELCADIADDYREIEP